MSQLAKRKFRSTVPDSGRDSIGSSGTVKVKTFSSYYGPIYNFRISVTATGYVDGNETWVVYDVDRVRGRDCESRSAFGSGVTRTLNADGGYESITIYLKTEDETTKEAVFNWRVSYEEER